MLKKETKTAVTQTELAGVAQVTKIKEPKEVLCSICVEQSLCQWCVEAEEKKLVETSEIVKLRRTQDILLAYKPCYVVATASEEMRSPHLQPAGKMKKIETPSTAKLYAARCATPEKTNINDSTIDDITLSKENIQVKSTLTNNKYMFFSHINFFKSSSYSIVFFSKLLRRFCLWMDSCHQRCVSKVVVTKRYLHINSEIFISCVIECF